jgi:XTP/dITP diphosphohydrolase
MQQLLAVMRRLRGPGGCPWDQEQSHQSLRPYLLEEAAEAVDALGHQPLDGSELASELGDVLLQVAFHSVIAEESGLFGYDDVETSIVAKLIRRHPHIFGDTLAPDSAAPDSATPDSATVVANWQAIKRQERAERGLAEPHPAERVPRALGALARSSELAKALGLASAPQAAVATALAGASDDGAGVADVLEAVVAWARDLGVNAELALRERADQRLQAALAQQHPQP